MNTNNAQKIRILEILSLVFCFILSFINHFLYKWLNYSFWIAPIVPINESVWEHGKLLFMPFMFWAIFEYFLIKHNPNYIIAKCVPLVFCTPIMIAFFYTYTGILGFHITLVDILMALTIILIMNCFSYKNLIYHPPYKKSGYCLLILTIIIFILFIIFTYYPPKIPLFISKQ